MDGQIKKTRQHYPRQMMIQVAMEVITGIKGPIEAARDYNVCSKHWRTKYANLIEGLVVTRVQHFCMNL